MNNLPRDLQVSVLHHLVEGNSIRSTNRLTKVSRDTILSLLERVGAFCKWYQDFTFQDLKFSNIQADELWTFCYAKKKNATKEMKRNLHAGDAWTWIAIDANSKLVFSWLVGGTRDQCACDSFMHDVSSRFQKHITLTTDANPMYRESIESGAFGPKMIDYGILKKEYTIKNGKRNTKNLKIERIPVLGQIKEKEISTGYVERFNLSMRMGMRRFTRKTNAFSKKFENLEHQVAFYCMYYNFVRSHMTLKSTPAIRAGITSRKWEIEDILDLMDGYEINAPERLAA